MEFAKTEKVSEGGVFQWLMSRGEIIFWRWKEQCRLTSILLLQSWDHYSIPHTWNRNSRSLFLIYLNENGRLS